MLMLTLALMLALPLTLATYHPHQSIAAHSIRRAARLGLE
jgi:hypothetical protein